MYNKQTKKVFGIVRFTKLDSALIYHSNVCFCNGLNQDIQILTNKLILLATLIALILSLLT